MKLGLPRRQSSAGGASATSGVPRCLQCGVLAPRPDQTFCRRCGLPYGDPPRSDAELPMCPICYRTVDDDGRVPAQSGHGRLDLVGHMAEHDRYPVGDEEFLESLREGDRIRIGRHYAPFALVRRYLVTGALDGGRRRAMEHTAIVTAMKQVARWGPNGTVIGDQAEWVEARAAVSDLMDRYHGGRA
jgi:hypothetical protein